MDVRHRLSTLVVVCVCLFGTLFARMTYLQVVQGSALLQQAESNLTQRVIVPANRGRIFDRQGRILVDNQTVLKIIVVKAGLPARKVPRAAVFDRLSGVLGISAQELTKRFEAVDDLEGVEVASGVTESAVVYLAEHEEDFPGVESKLDSARVYPQGTMASHVLGYVSDIGDDLKNPICDARYQTGDQVGKAGVERAYECTLRGMPGLTEYVVDRRNKVVETRVLAAPIAGTDLHLTLDPDIQAFTENALDDGLRAARNQAGYVYLGGGQRKKELKAGTKPFKANAGVAIVIDTSNGAILSSVSRPDYPPAEFTRGIPAKEYTEKYGSETANAPLTNRAISGRYAPGSTFKLITAVSALTNGLITERSTYLDEGEFKIPDCKNLKCTFSNSGGTSHGRVDLAQSLVVSSDVFYYWLGYRFWNEGSWPKAGIQETAREFGFGDDSGIALPYEKSSPVPDEAGKKARHESDPDIWPDGDWRTGDNLNLAIGQGEMLTTPLQLALAYGAFGNGGILYVPRIAFDTPPNLKPTIDTELLAPIPTSRSTNSTTLPVAITQPAAEPETIPVSTLATSAAPNRGANNGRYGLYLPAQSDTTTPIDSSVPSGTDVPSIQPLTVDENGFPVLQQSEGTVLTATVRRRVDLSADVRDPILAALRGVVSRDDGTARAAFDGFPFDGFPIAGKTGTAQVEGKQDFALFVAFGGPNYRYAVVVVLEQAGFGGQAAAPVARQIFNGLAGLGVGEVTYVQSTGSQDR